MFPDYKNWIPRSVIILFSILSGMSLAAFLTSSFLLFSLKGNISIFITLIFFCDVLFLIFISSMEHKMPPGVLL